MQADLSPHWKVAGKGLCVVHNFTDVRAKVDFLIGGDNILNETLLSTNNALKQTGANVVYDGTATRQIHYIINGKNQTRTSLVMKGYRCVVPCLPAISAVAIENTTRLWILSTSWSSARYLSLGRTW